MVATKEGRRESSCGRDGRKLAVVRKGRIGYDDLLDFVGIRGVGGVVGILAMALFSLVGTWLIFNVVEAIVGLRVSTEDESTGLNLSQHNERAYSYIVRSIANSKERIALMAGEGEALFKLSAARCRLFANGRRR